MREKESGRYERQQQKETPPSSHFIVYLSATLLFRVLVLMFFSTFVCLLWALKSLNALVSAALRYYHGPRVAHFWNECVHFRWTHDAPANRRATFFFLSKRKLRSQFLLVTLFEFFEFSYGLIKVTRKY